MTAVKRTRSNFASVGIAVCTFCDKSNVPYMELHNKLISKFPFKNYNIGYLNCSGRNEDRPFEQRTDTHKHTNTHTQTHTVLVSWSCIPATFNFSIHTNLHFPSPPYFPNVSVLRISSGFVWSNDSESYAGRSVATGRASRVRQVKGDDPDKKGYAASAVWVFWVELTTPHHTKYVLLRRF
jgi:hypothetical protein